jgi:3-oxoisoapionate decarboxylase
MIGSRAVTSVRWGIGSYTFGWAAGTYGASFEASGRTFLTLDALLARAIEARAQVVQVSVRPDVSMMDDGALRAAAQEAARRHLEIETGMNGTDPPVLRAHLSAAQRLGARLVRTVLRDAHGDIERSGNEIAEVLPAFEHAGVALAIENFEAFSARRHAELIRGLGSAFVGSCIDTVNNLGCGEGTDEVLETLVPWVLCLHLKDFVATRSRADSGFEITGCPLGSGRLPVDRVISSVLRSNPGASIILEQWIPYQGTPEATIDRENEWAAAGIPVLREIAGRHAGVP